MLPKTIALCAVSVLLAAAACGESEGGPAPVEVTTTTRSDTTVPTTSSPSRQPVTSPPRLTTVPTTSPADAEVGGVPLSQVLEQYEPEPSNETAFTSYELDCYLLADEPSSNWLGWEAVPIRPDQVVGRGSVLSCDVRTDPPSDRGGPDLIVLDDQGSTTSWWVGTDEVGHLPFAPPGLLCREYIATEDFNWAMDWMVQGDGGSPPWTDDVLAYQWALAYWFLEGEPERMDDDHNGIPCELLFDPGVVAEVWAGTATTQPTSFGAPIDLGGTTANDINNAGMIVGTLGGVSGEGEQGTVGQDDARAIWWPDPTSDPRLLDVAPGELSFGWAVNDQGEILVRTGHPESPTAAVVLDPRSGVIAELPAPENGSAEAWAFNDRGEVLVRIRQGWEQQYPEFVVWNARTDEIELPPGLGDHEYVLSDINAHGDVVGHVLAPFGVPFFWDRTQDVIHSLDLGDAGQGYATALNDRGQIIGVVRADMQEPGRPTVWVDYSSPPRSFDGKGEFLDINDSGQIVAGNSVLDLDSEDVADLPPGSGYARAINDLGDVVGQLDGHAALWNQS
jgi:uncharacterized membrane protein